MKLSRNSISSVSPVTAAEVIKNRQKKFLQLYQKGLLENIMLTMIYYLWAIHPQT